MQEIILSLVISLFGFPLISNIKSEMQFLTSNSSNSQAHRCCDIILGKMAQFAEANCKKMCILYHM